MTTFDDGPARGVILDLKRAPIFLRVVRRGTLAPKWDANNASRRFMQEMQILGLPCVLIIGLPASNATIRASGCLDDPNHRGIMREVFDDYLAEFERETPEHSRMPPPPKS